MSRDVIDVNAKDLDETHYLNAYLVEECAVAVSNGWAITEWCRENKINYGSFMSAIRRIPAHQLRISEAEISRQEWLKEELLKVMRQILQHNPQKCFDEYGHYLGMNNLPEESAKIIKKAKIKLVKSVEDPDGPPDEILDLEFYDKQKSIDQLGKYIQMFVERVDVHHKLTLEDTVTRSYELDIEAKKKQEGDTIDTTANEINSLLDTAIQNQSK